jgi:BirA family biotin operon repressor/biotin-[acetyl-CoA-carboxylase] ligase
MKCIHLDHVDSTNRYARSLAQHEPRGPDVCIVACTQSAGRGTRGHTWQSPPGGLYLSVLQRALPASAVPTAECTRRTGDVVTEHLHAATALPIEIKPVNDLLLYGDKLGGILVEAVVEHGALTCLVTGVGINVLTAPALPPDGPWHATALAHHVDEAIAMQVLDLGWIMRVAEQLATAHRTLMAPPTHASASY